MLPSKLAAHSQITLKKSSDWAPLNSVALKNGGLTELGTSTIYQLAHESNAPNSVFEEDLTYFAHLTNTSNGLLSNNSLFTTKKKEYHKKDIPESLMAKSEEEIRQENYKKYLS